MILHWPSFYANTTQGHRQMGLDKLYRCSDVQGGSGIDYLFSSLHFYYY